ncbi:hypothetical protein N0V90_006135 [Kalmusia sp. IMI 367209]|nr:hypothetical protein N0V90_006135 [Kalmusia sp. IMI 367209]
MGVDTSELIVPLVGALQASISVLITIFLGVLTAQFNLLSTGAAKEVSRTCVRMFLPALLIYKLGTNLDKNTGIRYLPILFWSISYTLVSLAIGVLACRVFRLPNWVKLAVAFNNTTSLPLLLIQSLKTTGVLDAIIPPGDDASQALDRAESYFLINAMVSNSLTFALGPRLLRPSDEDAPEDDNKEGEESDDGEEEQSMERGVDGIIDEETSLLPQRAVRPINGVERRGYKRTQRWLQSLPPWAQQTLGFLYQFANAPLLGTVVGAIIGLTPPLHRLFFNDSDDGGYFNAWLTTAIKNIGDLFATTQIIVVGVKLSQSLRKMNAGEDSGTVDKKSMAFVFLIRFFVWPAVSIPLIYALATKTSVLSSDPMLWFAMMLMSSGPSAMILVALTDVTGSPEEEKMAIAKFLTVALIDIEPLLDQKIPILSLDSSFKLVELTKKGVCLSQHLGNEESVVAVRTKAYYPLNTVQLQQIVMTTTMTRVGLLSLPAELSIRIFELFFHLPSNAGFLHATVPIPGGPQPSQGLVLDREYSAAACLNILLVCRQLRDEFTNLAFRNTVFVIRHDPLDMNPRTIRSILPHQFENVRNLILVADDFRLRHMQKYLYRVKGWQLDKLTFALFDVDYSVASHLMNITKLLLTLKDVQSLRFIRNTNFSDGDAKLHFRS